MIWFKLWRDSRKHALGGLGMVLGIALFYLALGPSGLSIFGVDPTRLPHLPLVAAALPNPDSPAFASYAWWLIYLNAAVIIAPLLGIVTAGCGISGQGIDGIWRGRHPSVIYTLSLPVTRRRWMCARAALGLLQMAVLVLLLVIIPAALAPLTGGMFLWRSALVSFLFLILGAGVFNALSTFLATFLAEDQQAIAAAAAALGLAILATSGQTAGKSVFGFMSGLHPSVAGVLACLAVMTVFFAGALWVIERREY